MKEIERILNMVKEGKITAEEGETLISSLDNKNTEGIKSCNLKIKIIENKNGKTKTNVNLNFPVKIASLLVKATGKISFKVLKNNEKVKESLSNYGIDISNDGEIVDVDAFVDALNNLCDIAPVNLVNLIDEEDDNSQTLVKICVE